MISYVQSRYDRLTGQLGTQVILPDPVIPDPIKFSYVYGPRRSGRTTYLCNDLLEYKNGGQVGFFSSVKEIVRNSNVSNVCFDSHFNLLGYKHRGCEWDRIYIDDIDQLEFDDQNILLQNITTHVKYIMVSSTRKQTHQFLNWNLITLQPLYWTQKNRRFYGL